MKLDRPSTQLTKYAYQASIAARETADRLGNRVAKAYTNGYLGHLYEQSKRYKEALRLTRQAIFFAQQTREQSLLYFWEWQLGRIQKAQGNTAEAITSYQRAIENLRPIRAQVATTGYFNITESFREKVAPVYFELSDLLLKEAVASSTASRRDKLLRQARKTIEFFKEAELQDYFQSDCVAFGNECTDLEQILDDQTAVLYPIVLPDRLELLLHKGGHLMQATVQVKEVDLRDKIASFLSPLRRHPFSDIARDTSSVSDDSEASQSVICTLSAPRGASEELAKLTETYMKPSRTLYNWLIKPLAAQLEGIKTLVVVPDGVLRTMPFSALYDGEQFLVQKHALVLTPSLCLSQPQSSRQKRATVLLGGLSASVQGFSSLPCAGNELDIIDGMFETTYKPLMNEQFTHDKLKTALNQSGYSIVHIASHGQFSGNLDNTFILTFDDKLSMDGLEELMSLSTIKGNPVELLTLSACETAVGDDRAALGLAGVALKAGVKSALASLWKVDDAATQSIVIEFYRQLQNPTVSKAMALQNAQKMLLMNQEYEAYQHPYFWSAFMLIGNWL
jgi:CHAT domain-containing protein